MRNARLNKKSVIKGLTPAVSSQRYSNARSLLLLQVNSPSCCCVHLFYLLLSLPFWLSTCWRHLWGHLSAPPMRPSHSTTIPRLILPRLLCRTRRPSRTWPRQFPKGNSSSRGCLTLRHPRSRPQRSPSPRRSLMLRLLLFHSFHHRPRRKRSPRPMRKVIPLLPLRNLTRRSPRLRRSLTCLCLRLSFHRPRLPQRLVRRTPSLRRNPRKSQMRFQRRRRIGPSRTTNPSPMRSPTRPLPIRNLTPRRRTNKISKRIRLQRRTMPRLGAPRASVEGPLTL